MIIKKDEKVIGGNLIFQANNKVAIIFYNMKSNFKKAKSFYKKSEKSSIENHNPLEVVKTMVNELKKSMNIVVSSTGQNEQNSVRAKHFSRALVIIYTLQTSLDFEKGEQLEMDFTDWDSKGMKGGGIAHMLGQPRVPMMYGGDPGFAFEYGGSWADWRDNHQHMMPLMEYIGTKLPKERTLLEQTLKMVALLSCKENNHGIKIFY